MPGALLRQVPGGYVELAVIFGQELVQRVGGVLAQLDVEVELGLRPGGVFAEVAVPGRGRF